MKIRKIRLQNIKSYVDQEITFNEGVNFISGINGAGKSTIIEAIGFALFDHHPGTIGEFLRYGTKTGTITVEFCGIDEREYRVVRKLGTSSLWTVFDLESGGELDLHGTRDVKNWLKEAMGIDQDMELEHLFRDIVGVPQGTFVAPFLETPSLRKKKFDAILKVEQYRDAYLNTRAAAKLLDERMREQEKDLAVLAAEVQDYDAVKAQVQSVTTTIRELEETLQQLEGEVQNRAQKVTELERLKERLEKTEASLQALAATIEGLEQREKDLRENLAQAAQAYRVVRNAAPGYKAYLELQEKAKLLEKQKREKEGLEQEVNRLKQTMAALQAAIGAKEKEAAARAADLQAEEKELNNRLAENAALLAKAKEKYQRIMAGQEALLRWRQSEEKLAGACAGLQDIYREINAKGQLLEGSLVQEEAAILERLEELTPLEAVAEQLEAREKELNRSREEWAKLKERLHSLQKDSQQAADGLCPFLKSPCQNVAGDLRGFFARQIAEVQKELDSLKETGLRLADEVKEAKAAREKVLVLRAEKKRLQQIQQQKEAMTGEIAQLTLRFRRPDFAELLDELRKTGDLPSDELEKCCNLWNREWQDERDLDTVLAAVEAVLEQSGTRRAAKEKDFNERLQEASNTLTRYSTEKENIIRALDQVQAKKKLLADDLAALEQEKKKLSDMEARVGETAGKAAAFKGVEEALENTRTAQEQRRRDYELYMENRATAAKKDSLERELQKLSGEIANKKDQYIRLQEEKQQLVKSFNPTAYNLEKAELDMIKQKHIAQNQILQERKNDLQEAIERLGSLEKKLAAIKKLEEDMRRTRKTQRLLEAIRGILNNAGAPIAKVYLENLSQEANEIYRQISSENAMLEWRSDYDICLTDNFQGRERVRIFKQFSGGEQMTAALAVRLALLKQQSQVRIGFFDEPTANLDTDRRLNLADTIPRVTGDFDQLFIISHDDTFDSMTDNIIQIKKDTEAGSMLE
ncbi:SMC domain-containing protein [Thermincola ferriacetica]|uniref:Nuclease SbcCD subunit C n=1 Tax=Thermincola ferriacetica TaxID=281456 RepID=A0A0L6W1K4_9FIRM|nr:SMC family ATPase [Thermincola ferriacetica]KNZ69283.1 SMC domain-containing protein [Thermincola ferriacetica]